MIDKLPDGLVVEEIHKIRRAIHDRFGGDVKAILADARKRQKDENRNSFFLGFNCSGRKHAFAMMAFWFSALFELEP